MIDQNVSGITNSEYIPSSPLDPNTKYYWRVSSYNTSNQYSSWSAVRYFRTALQAPTLSAPSNGLLTTCVPITMQWGTVSGATSYTLVYSTSSTFLMPVTITTTSASVPKTITIKNTYFGESKPMG